MNMDGLAKIGMIMQATGMGLKGQNGASVYDKYYQDQEKEKRKANIQGLLDSMQISQQKRAFLEMLPFEQASPIIWDLMNPKPVGGSGRAPTQEELAAQFAASLGDMGAAPQQAQAGGGFSMGVPADLGSPVAASGGLSMGMPAVESPAPATTQGLSFGNIQTKAPAPVNAGNLYETAKRKLAAEIPTIIKRIRAGDPAASAYLEQQDKLLKRLEMFAPQVEESPIASLEARARAAGLQPDTAEYRNFMLTNGRNDGLVIESDGQGGFRVAQGAAAGSQKPFTEMQSKDNVFVTRATGAMEVLEPIAETLTSRAGRAAEMDPTGFAREWQSDDFQVAKQAGDEFLQAILRKDTGAAITEPEQYLYGRTYLPQPGDSAAVLQAKSAARKRAVEAIKAGMSPAQMIAVEKALGNPAVPQEQPPASYNETPIVGGFVQPNEQAANMLKGDPSPERRAQFDEIFGPGAAARILGE